MSEDKALTTIQHSPARKGSLCNSCGREASTRFRFGREGNSTSISLCPFCGVLLMDAINESHLTHLEEGEARSAPIQFNDSGEVGMPLSQAMSWERGTDGLIDGEEAEWGKE